MKHIKLLFVISAFFYIAKIGNAQEVVYDSTQYLTLYYHTHRDFGNYSTKFTKQNLDSTWFTAGKEKFLAIGKKIFLRDSFLVFDYDKKPGDTLNYHYTFIGDTIHQTPYVIDSIQDRTLFNNKSYRHFYCKSLKNERYMTYIEGLGEGKYGWGAGNLYSVPEEHGVVGICIGHNEVVKWSSIIVLKDKYVEPTCNFDSIRNLSSISNLERQSISIYPNPAHNIINFGHQLAGEYYILNQLGQTVSSGKFNNEIPIENLISGLYYLQIKTAKGEWFSAKVQKL